MPYGTLALDAISTSGNLTVAGNVAVTGTFALGSQALGTPFAGEMEYNGGELYFTPLSTQRGLIPSAQYYRLNSAVVGSNVTTAQSFLEVGVTLSSATVYYFESVFAISKSAGVTGHTIATGFGGTATINNIGYHIHNQGDSVGFTSVPYDGTNFNKWINVSTAAVVTGSIGVATAVRVLHIRGTVSINAGGTFIPQYTLSAAPGGAYSTQVGSYFLIYPIGSAGSNISIGTWA